MILKSRKFILFRIKRLINSIKNDGLIWTISRLFLKLFNEPNEIKKSKLKILKHLVQINGYNVAYGEFKGMNVENSNYWSNTDMITFILGTYEQPVVNQLIQFGKQNNSVFIDIGAGDGYYSVGMAYSNFFKKIYTFEIDHNSQERIKKNAQTNNCIDKINILGEANYFSLKNIINNHKTSVVKIDIEGSEFELLNEEVLILLSKSFIVVELHPLNLVDGEYEEKRLLEKCKKYFDLSWIRRENYNPNFFKELYKFTDEERLIALGEGRSSNMRWLVLKTYKL